MPAPPISRVTPEEYLAADRAAEFRSEFYDGYVHTMAGGSFTHAVLAANISTELNRSIGERPCVVASSGARVCIGRSAYVYPDVIVVCGPVEYDADERDTVVNAVIVVEVLSKSTQADDRGAKFGYYRKMPSLREYLLVSQTTTRVEVFRRQAKDKWELSDYEGLEAIIPLDSIQSEIRLAGIYNKIDLPPEPVPPLT